MVAVTAEREVSPVTVIGLSTSYSPTREEQQQVDRLNQFYNPLNRPVQELHLDPHTTGILEIAGFNTINQVVAARKGIEDMDILGGNKETVAAVVDNFIEGVAPISRNVVTKSLQAHENLWTGLAEIPSYKILFLIGMGGCTSLEELASMTPNRARSISNNFRKAYDRSEGILNVGRLSVRAQAMINERSAA